MEKRSSIAENFESYGSSACSMWKATRVPENSLLFCGSNSTPLLQLKKRKLEISKFRSGNIKAFFESLPVAVTRGKRRCGKTGKRIAAPGRLRKKLSGRSNRRVREENPI